MKRTLILTILALALSASIAEAERYYYFDHLDMTDGLISNTIFCSVQDRNGFVWIGTRDGLCRYDGSRFTNISDLVPGYESDGAVFAVEEDENGKIWFSTTSGLNNYDPMTNEFLHIGKLDYGLCLNIEADGCGNIWATGDNLFRYSLSDGNAYTYTLGESNPTSVITDGFGTTWATNADGVLYTYDKLNDKLTAPPYRYKTQKIAKAEEGKIIVLTEDNEVLYMDCITLKSTHIFQSESTVHCILEREKGECWIGTVNGLFIRKSEEAYNGAAYHDDATPESISADYITCLSKDSSGNVWAGTFYTGMNLWQNKGNEQARYFMNPSSNTMMGKIVRSIVQDHKGYIWICTEDGWLNRLDPVSNRIRNYKLDDGLNLQGLIADEGKLWISSYGHGVYLFNMDTEKVDAHYDIGNNWATLGLKTAGGDILIGTSEGLYRWDKSSGTFILDERCGTDFIHCLYQDNLGTVWIGTSGNGIHCIDEMGGKLSHISRTDKEGSLPSKFITSFFEDSMHRMWITTEGGGVCYTEPDGSYDNLSFSRITKKDGLPSNVTCAIAEDSDGTLWISTANGIISYSPASMQVTGLIELKGFQFSYNSVCTTRNGIFYFGNTDGFFSFIPARMKGSEKKHDLFITDITAENANETITLHEDGKSVMYSDRVSVKHKQAASVAIRYVVPYFTSKKPLYSYSVSKGRRELFSGVTQDTELTFTGLRSGTYTLRIGTVGKGEDPEYLKSLEIRIIPAPFMSWPARLIYVLLIIITITAIIISIDNKRKNDRARQLTKLVNKKEKELYNAKINYFTNLTHEIRTPLTLIKMPLDKIISSGAYTPESEKDLRTIQANTDRLLSLSNQILDMRKMEENEIKLTCVKENLCDIVIKASKYFEQMALDQHITLTADIPEKPIFLMCAKDSIVTIVSNLLSNAVKYGNDKINVSVSSSEDGQTAYVRVDSNGEHIPEADRERIFNIFFQRDSDVVKGRISQGTGLGLPYARTLANMHNGRLYLDMNVSDMNSFVLELPVRLEESVSSESSTTTYRSSKTSSGYDNSRHTILIAEDSEDMRDYLADELSDSYNVLKAANGADAMALLKSEKIDLVVSDIMMPVMDGCELCNRIKTDSDLSHVPVILLTAAIGVETRIETLEIGADGYIEKPFPIELLRSNISNLFRNKEISYKQFINKPLTHYNSITASKVDEEYINKLHDFIMKHISETDLNIENLTMQLGTSKSSLYRKLKANTGLSINEYIRVCRLKQAAELLSTQKYMINEVAFMTGFSSPSYFATCFQKQFNLSPSDFVKNLGQ